MAREWPAAALCAVYEFASGLSKPRSEFGFGYGFVTFKDVLDNYFLPDKLTALVNSSDKDRLACSVRRGDVFLTRTSETQDELGMSCVALKDHPDATFNGFTKRLRPKFGAAIVPEYAGYYFRGPKFRQAVTAMSSLTTRASLNNEMLARLTIVLPPVEVQSAIAQILKSLDDKIELNRRMNETLEATARALFKSWFVDFDAEIELAKSEIGPLPRGWRVGSISDVAANVRDAVSPEAVDPDTRYVGLEHVPQRTGWLEAWGTASEVASGKARFRKGDVLFGKLRPYFHKVVLAAIDGVCSTDILVIRPHSEAWTGFAFGHLFSNEMVSHATALSDGTKMPRTSWENLCRFPVAIPPPDRASAFQDLCRPLLGLVAANAMESRTIAAMRDALLPKLLSGEIRVKDAEKMVGA